MPASSALTPRCGATHLLDRGGRPSSPSSSTRLRTWRRTWPSRSLARYATQSTRGRYATPCTDHAGHCGPTLALEYVRAPGAHAGVPETRASTTTYRARRVSS
eukprot:scaffold18586_cov59-Phaeocystis_antarctica.AAC.6